jgi:signal transduction histidine kinase
LVVFEVCVIVPTLAGLAISAYRAPQDFQPILFLWAAVIAVVELLPVPSWRGLQISTGFPLMMAVAFLYAPWAAAATAFLGASDPREFRREVSVTKALFNRCQIALSVLLASLVFQQLATIKSNPADLLLAALVATVVDYLANVFLVAIYSSLSFRLPLLQVVRELRVGQLSEFVISYIGLGLVGVVVAKLYDGVGFWSVPTFLVPLVFARQMFFRGKALEEAHAELKQREVVLEQLSNRMAEERQDERAQIAAYLHDDLAQLLFRLSLQVDIAKRHLGNGSEEEVVKDLELIRDTKNRTNELVRALIRDLHRSPLGRAGLGEALKSFTQEVGGSSGVKFNIEIADLPLPPPIALLMYHISREAVMNALKHSRASNINISLEPHDDVVELRIADDGVGFDADGPGPEGHFGLTMMRDRAQVAGGTFKIESKTGEGTTITATFAQSWLHEESEEPGEQAAASASLTEPPRTREIKPGLVPPPETSERTGQAVHA